MSDVIPCCPYCESEDLDLVADDKFECLDCRATFFTSGDLDEFEPDVDVSQEQNDFAHDEDAYLDSYYEDQVEIGDAYS